MMTSWRGLAAALLFAAASARAQLELSAPSLVSARAALAPTISAPALAPAASALTAPALALAAAPAALVALPPALAAPAAAAPAAPGPAVPAAAARAENIRAAVADFAALDLGAIGADATRAAGDALMRRALEEGVPASAAPAAPAGGTTGRRLYLLSKPLRVTVELGPAARVAHAGYAAAWELFKAWVGWHATGHVMGGVAVLAVELPFSPAMLTGRSLLDLGARYWRRKLAVLRELARAPGVERVRVLTAGQVEFAGPLARRKENTGLLFVDAAAPPPTGRFGAAIPIEDASRQLVRLTLESRGSAALVAWTPTLADLLERRPLPREIAAAWRESLKTLSHERAPLSRLADSVTNGALRIEAALVGGPSGGRSLGAIVEGPAVRTFIGLGRLDRVRALLGRELTSRSIPLSDTVVERPGEARARGVWELLVRAWRRLSGRLIVRPAEG
jgi:hypothetical protein